MQRFKKILSLIFRILISIVILFLLFRQVDEKKMLEIIGNADKPLLFFSFLVFFIPYIICIFRWEMLLKAANIHIPLKRVVVSLSGGVFFNLVLPSTVGGDFLRSVDLATHTKKAKEVVATVLLDRLSGYSGLVLLAIVAVFLAGRVVQEPTVLIPLVAIILLLVVILLVLFNNFIYSKINKLLNRGKGNRIAAALRNLHHEIHLFRNRKDVLFKNLLLSVFIQVFSPLSFYFVAKSLGIEVNIIYFFIFIPVVSAITLLPISIGGLGLRDATIIFFFSKIAVSKDMAFAMSLLSFLFLAIISSIGGLIYVFNLRYRRLQPDKPSTFCKES